MKTKLFCGFVSVLFLSISLDLLQAQSPRYFPEPLLSIKTEISNDPELLVLADILERGKTSEKYGVVMELEQFLTAVCIVELIALRHFPYFAIKGQNHSDAARV